MVWMVIIYGLIAATVVAAFTIPNERLEWRSKHDPKPENRQR